MNSRCLHRALRELELRQASEVVFWLVAAGLSGWPALYNGFPLVFGDTGTYVATVVERIVPVDRPVYYGVIVWATGWLVGPWGVVLAQAAFLLYALHVLLFHALPTRPLWTRRTLILLLLVLTQLPWEVAWMMPDVFACIGSIVLITLILYYETVGRVARVVLGLLLTLSALVATANLLLFSFFAILLFGIRWLLSRRPLWLPIPVLVCCYAVIMALAVLPNWKTYGRVTVNVGSQAFTFSRLITYGAAQAYLNQACATRAYRICTHLTELDDAKDACFLWLPDSLASRTDAWRDEDGEYSRLNREIIFSEWRTILPQLLTDGARLLSTTSLGADPLDDNWRSFGLGSSTQPRIALFWPNWTGRYESARQYLGELPRTSLNGFYQWETYASYVAMVVLLLVALVRRQGETMALCFAAGGLVVINALIHAALSGVYVRYQMKASWIPTLIVLIALSSSVRMRFERVSEKLE